MSRLRRHTRVAVWVVIIAVVAVNALMVMHARAMSRFGEGPDRTAGPDELGTWDRLRVLVTGIAVPRQVHHLDPEADRKAIAESVYRTDIYRAAARIVGEPAPTVDVKPEGLHATLWQVPTEGGPLTMGSDRFFDGQRFEPEE